MKIKVKMVCGNGERTIKVSCYEETEEDRQKRDVTEGEYDRRLSFKWLGMVAAQRFAMEAPRGAVRRYDEMRGITDRVQQLPQNMTITRTKQEPHPEDKLEEFLRDDDEVVINLMDNNLAVTKFGSPKNSVWAAAAFISPNEDKPYPDEFEESKHSSAEDKHDFSIDKQAKVEFMRVVLNTQMLDHHKISHQLNVHFAHVIKNTPKLKSSELTEIKNICDQSYSALFELFQNFSSYGKMKLLDYQQFIQKLDIHSSREFDSLTKKDFRRAAASCEDDELHFGGFLYALLLTSQTIHIDTLDKESKVYDPIEAFQMLIQTSIIPYAHKFPHELDLKFIIREKFFSDECLIHVKALHDSLFAIFEKYANRSARESLILRVDGNKDTANRDLPSLTLQDMAELLYDANLVKEYDTKSIEKCRGYLKDAQSGLIVGRSTIDSESKQEGRSAYSSPPAMDEFTFAEFVDASSRAGIDMYKSRYDITQCMLKGLHDVANATHKVNTQTKSAFGSKR